MIRYRIIYQHSNIEAPMGRFDIGRSVECNLVLDDPSVSRVHASIIRNESGLFIEDRGSRNGCSVNGKRVNGTVPISDGDEIMIGHQSIRISAVTVAAATSSARNTMGLRACPKCGNWMPLEEKSCRVCESNQTQIAVPLSDSTDQDRFTGTETRLPTIHSHQMLTGLARKAMGKNRYDEALRLIASLMESTLKKAQTGQTIPESELSELTELIIDLSVEEKKAEHISTLFAFYYRLRLLIPRKSVEILYQNIRKSGYRTCPEMTRYLSVLAELSRNFSPGEKFIHRRIEGLVGLCS